MVGAVNVADQCLTNVGLADRFGEQSRRVSEANSTRRYRLRTHFR